MHISVSTCGLFNSGMDDTVASCFNIDRSGPLFAFKFRLREPAKTENCYSPRYRPTPIRFKFGAESAVSGYDNTVLSTTDPGAVIGSLLRSTGLSQITWYSLLVSKYLLLDRDNAWRVRTICVLPLQAIVSLEMNRNHRGGMVSWKRVIH